MLKAGACLTLAPLAFGQDNPASQRPKAGDLLIRVSGTDPSPLRPSDISPGSKQLFVWAMDPETNYETSFIPQGVGADLIATIEEFGRDDVDAYAARSQERAATAQVRAREAAG